MSFTYSVGATVSAALVATLGLSLAMTPALAQDAAFALPPQCLAPADMGAMDHAAMGHGAADGAMDMDMDMGDMPEHVQENMAKMAITMPAMEQGMMIEDPDVAFACAMIAHHQGALDMAQVMLDHGDDPEMLELAREIMAAQVGEITQMTEWLAANAN